LHALTDTYAPADYCLELLQHASEALATL